MKYEEIPVEKTCIDEDVKLRFDYDVEGLARDIKRNGQLEPVLAYEKDGKHFIFVGMRRYFAVRRLYENGELSTIRANVYEKEPDMETKLRLALSENENRTDLNIYEKMAFVLKNISRSDRLVAEGVVSKRLVMYVRSIISSVSLEKLKRWYEIETRLGGVKLKLDHLAFVSRLPQEEQDFAVFFIRALDISESALRRINFRVFVMHTPLTEELKKTMNELGIRNPYESNAEKSTAKEQPQQNLHVEHEEEEIKEEEQADVLLFDAPVKSFSFGSKIYVLYLEKEPEIIQVKVEKDKIVEIEDRKFRIKTI